MSESKLPEELWPIRDAVIASVNEDRQLPNDFVRLTEWLQYEGYDELLSHRHDEYAVNLGKVMLSDSDLRDHLELDHNYILSNTLRAKFSRQWILDLSEELEDGLLFPSPISYPLISDLKDSPILGCTLEIHGQAGPVFFWHGIFRNEGEFHACLRQKNIFRPDELENINDEILLSAWDWSRDTPKHKALRSKPLDERIRLVCEDLKRKKNGGKSYYRNMPVVRLAELIGVEDFTESPSDWMPFVSISRQTFDELREYHDIGAEEAAKLVVDIIDDNLSVNALPVPSSQLAAKAPLLKTEKSRQDLVHTLGEDLTLELEDLLNFYVLESQASNGILGHAIWDCECANGMALRFQVDISDLGEVDEMLGPYDDLLGKFSDGDEFVVSWRD